MSEEVKKYEMRQLTLKDLYDFCLKQIELGIKIEDIQVYLGDDDELNGVHTGWFITPIYNRKGITDDNDYVIDMINENSGNIELKKKGVLIS